MNDKCKKCDKKSFLLNKNNLCIICVFGIDSDPNENKIFKETGKELKEQLNPSFYDMFRNQKPVCRKCNKEVDLFGPIYVIEMACTRFVFTKCHGEVEVRMFTEIKMNDKSYDLDYHLKNFFNK